MVYFANNDGVLEFDGNQWRTIPMPNFSVVRSLAVDEDDRIYVGAFNEFGYLEADKEGKLIYHSIVHLLPESEKEFEEVWKIVPYRKGILFHSFQKDFYYKDGKISVLQAENEFQRGYLVGDDFYVRVQKKGLYRLEGNEYQLIDGGEKFSEKEIVSLLPFGKGKVLIATALDGLFLYDGKGIGRFITDLNKRFRRDQLYAGHHLGNGTFAYGTVRNGLYIINETGDLIQHINKDFGLQNNTVLTMFLDQEENLWLGLDNGIDYLEISSPISTFPQNRDLGSGYSAAYHNGKLYLGTNIGLFVSDYDFNIDYQKAEERFELVQNTSGQVWSLQVIDGDLICGHNKGTFLIKGNRGELISDVEGGWKYLYKKEFPNKMIGGTYTGLVLFEKVNGKWRFNKKIDGFDESSREMVWNKDHSIWMCHGYKGVYKISLNEALDACVKVDFYGKKNGLPSNLNINVSSIKNENVFLSQNGFYKYMPELDSFQEHQYLNNLLGKEEPVHKLFQLKNGDVWFFQGENVGLLKLQVDGSYEAIRQPFAPLQGMFLGAFENVYVVDNENVIIGRENGFVHYNAEMLKRYDTPYYTHIREVKVSGHNRDSIVSMGNYQKTNRDTTSLEKLVLPFRNNGIQFYYSTPQNHNSQLVSYQLRLHGFDEQESVWVTNTRKEYTNLPEGDYIFKVLAKNQYGIESVSDEFHFSILPPWYRSVVAYILYVLGGIAFIVLVVYLIRRRMNLVQKRLEEQKQEELREKEQKFREEALIAEREIVQLRNDKLRTEVEFKNRELASSTMNIIHKNEVLVYAVGELKKALRKIKDPTALVQVRQCMKTIDAEFNSEQDWEQFEVHFDQVHENFLKRLRIGYPQLTPKDLKMCAYLRMNLSTKEIAPLMNISVRGVEISRYRLRKKLDLNRDDNLIDFLLNV